MSAARPEMTCGGWDSVNGPCGACEGCLWWDSPEGREESVAFKRRYYGLMDRTRPVLEAVRVRRVAVHEKRRGDDGAFLWAADPGLGLAVLMEEVGEVAEAILRREGSLRLEDELVDVAQVCVAWAEGLREARR